MEEERAERMGHSEGRLLKGRRCWTPPRTFVRPRRARFFGGGAGARGCGAGADIRHRCGAVREAVPPAE